MAAEEDLGREQRSVGCAHHEDVVSRHCPISREAWLRKKRRPWAVLRRSHNAMRLALTMQSASLDRSLLPPGISDLLGSMHLGSERVFKRAASVFAFGEVCWLLGGSCQRFARHTPCAGSL